MEIILNNAKVEDTNYAIEESRVVLKRDYLEDLPAGEYKFTVRYNPMGEEFIENSTEGDKPEDITFTVKVQKAGLKAENFVYTEPEDLLYDEKAKVATVTSKISEISDDKITVKYYNSAGTNLTSAPTNAGTYTVKIDFVEGDNDAVWRNITADHWTFTIEKAAPTIKSTSTSVTYKHGLTLKDVPFPETKDNIPSGTWTWSYPGTVIQYAGDHRYEAIFTPNDSDNYATASRLIFVQVGKGKLSTGDFTFTPPEKGNAIYTGYGKSASVKPNGITGVGDITLKYYKLQVENGKLTIVDLGEKAPTDVGTYGVSIDVTEDVNYK